MHRSSKAQEVAKAAADPKRYMRNFVLGNLVPAAIAGLAAGLAVPIGPCWPLALAVGTAVATGWAVALLVFVLTIRYAD